MHSLTNVLNKIFVYGFYRAHAGVFIFIFLVFFGAVPGDQLLSYHKALMLAFLSSPLLLAVVFAIWLLYAAKSWHFVAGQLTQPHHQFLYYSTGAYSRKLQSGSWLIIQFNILMPVIVYALLALGVGIYYHTYAAVAAVILFLLLLIITGAVICRAFSYKLSEDTQQSALLRWSTNWRKPYFSLYIYHIFDQKKVAYIIVKLISWLVITAVFALFADVQHDARVAGIAVLCIAIAHAVIIFEERTFEETYLTIARNLPYRRIAVFFGFIAVYLLLLLPEIVWLFMRFQPLFAIQLLLLALSIMMLFHAMLYYIGLDMEKYMTRILALFMIIFWVIMFRAIGGSIAVNLIAGFLLFYFNYYRSFDSR